MVKERTEFGRVLTKNSPIAFCCCRFEFYVVFSINSTWLVSLSTLCRLVLWCYLPLYNGRLFYIYISKTSPTWHICDWLLCFTVSLISKTTNARHNRLTMTAAPPTMYSSRLALQDWWMMESRMNKIQYCSLLWWLSRCKLHFLLQSYTSQHPKALPSTRHPQYTSSFQGLKATSRTQGFHSQLINYKGSRLLQGLKAILSRSLLKDTHTRIPNQTINLRRRYSNNILLKADTIRLMNDANKNEWIRYYFFYHDGCHNTSSTGFFFFFFFSSLSLFTDLVVGLPFCLDCLQNLLETNIKSGRYDWFGW